MLVCNDIPRRHLLLFLDKLHSEADYAPADLDGLSLVDFELDRVLRKDKRAKF